MLTHPHNPCVYVSDETVLTDDSQGLDEVVENARSDLRAVPGASGSQAAVPRTTQPGNNTEESSRGPSTSNPSNINRPSKTSSSSASKSSTKKRKKKR